MNTRYTVVIALVAGLFVGGCVDDDRGFYIVQNQLPSDGCKVDTSAGTALYAGTLDVLGGQGYYLNPLVANNMPSTTVDKQPERNMLHLKRFQVTLNSSEIPLQDADKNFSIPISGVIQPGGQASFVGVPIVMQQTVARIMNNNFGYGMIVMAGVRVIANRSGDEIESSEFVYPITLCRGCLLGKVLPSCPTDTTDLTTNTCGLPQDAPTTCCKDPSRGIICLQGKDS